ncbi:MAG TPA: glycosyltransferase [Stellaceae bacterium]|nr:glycosyltransferase [Stellaceae bacterium]
MIFHLLGLLCHGVLLLALTALTLLGLWQAWFIAQHLSLRRSGLARESALLATPLPDDDRLPHVLFQLPTFNEGQLIRRLAAAVGAVDWPRDKVHVQILDDSTDESAVIAAEMAAAALRQHGLDAVLMHRANRAGFKAGALQEGLLQSRHEFVAIFDADYVPAPNFLRLCLRPMLREPRLGLVQARCDFINPDDNAITRVQQRLLDAHFAVEQATRSWSGQVLPFNGTCGVWRRAAIDAAGGWQGDTLTEDLDLSYRAQLAGWRALYLVTVAVPGELPDTVGGWRTQQYRWAKGFAQVARKLLPKVWRSDLALGRKLDATFHLGACIVGPLIGVAVAAGAVDALIGPGPTSAAIGLLATAVLLGSGGTVMMMLLGQRAARGASMLREAAQIPALLLTSLYATLFNLRGVVEGWSGRASAFVRTPKHGSLARKRA